MQGVIYNLDVISKGKRNSIEFNTRAESEGAFRFIVEKFSDHSLNRSLDNYSEKMVQVSTSETYVGGIPPGVMASFECEAWFEDVHREIVSAANEYKENLIKAKR